MMKFQLRARRVGVVVGLGRMRLLKSPLERALWENKGVKSRLGIFL